MLERIKNKYIQNNILKFIKQRQVLNFFKYSKYYQSKFNLEKKKLHI